LGFLFLDRGQTLYRQGDTLRKMAFIVEGSIVQCVEQAEGTRERVAEQQRARDRTVKI
jgi:hypothetical protein